MLNSISLSSFLPHLQIVGSLDGFVDTHTDHITAMPASTASLGITTLGRHISHGHLGSLRIVRHNHGAVEGQAGLVTIVTNTHQTC